MKVNFRYLTVDEIVNNILSWAVFEEEGPLPLSESCNKYFPMLKGKIDITMKGSDDLIITIKNLVKNQIEKDIKNLNNKGILEHYCNLWEQYNDSYKVVSESYFKTKLEGDVDAAVGIIPVCPRWIDTQIFYINTTTDEDIIDTCMHEICHFYFFSVCKKIFENWDYSKFNKPSLLWYLSEIAIDPILNRKEFQSVFKHNFRCYNPFYGVDINNKNIVDIMRDIFDNNDIENAIKIGLEFLKTNEIEFRIKCGEEVAEKIK